MSMISEKFLIFNPRPYQQQAIDELIRHPRFCLFLGMGLGKTVITLTALASLLDIGAVRKALIVAPKSVSQNVWDFEALNWEHLRHLLFSKITGTAATREKRLREPAEIYVCSSSVLEWLQDYCARAGIHFDAVIFDELSQYRNWTSERTKAARKLSAAANIVWGLTGTPSPNGLQDLFSEISLIDKGERFGLSVTNFRARYCTPRYYQNGIARGWYVSQREAPELLSRIRDITFTVDPVAAMKYDLPDCSSTIVSVTMPPELEAQYRDFKRDQVLACTSGETIAAVNAGALIVKLQQFASGCLYSEDVDRHTIHLHDAKIEALVNLIDELRISGYTRGILIAYNFAHEKERLLSALSTRGAVLFEGQQQYKDWNAGKIPILIAHPATAGHGLNLQHGGSVVVWFGLTYNLELHEQFNKRLHRSGQTDPVRIYYLSVLGTIEPQIITALGRKSDLQASVLEELKHRKSAQFI